MKAEINIHVDNNADRRSQVDVDVGIFRGEEHPAFYEETFRFYISTDDAPEEIYRALKDAEVNVHYWEE